MHLKFVNTAGRIHPKSVKRNNEFGIWKTCRKNTSEICKNCKKNTLEIFKKIQGIMHLKFVQSAYSRNLPYYLYTLSLNETPGALMVLSQKLLV